jgi:broad specificity phosphatase PhoE
MKPHAIYLVRHGESLANVNRDIHYSVPDWKVALTYKGLKQAKVAGNRLYRELKGKFDARSEAQNNVIRPLLRIYRSPYIRARQTCDSMRCEHFPWCEVREDPRLREQDWGNYMSPEVNKKIDEERDQYGTFFYRMPNGESGADVFDRVTTFLDTLYRDFENPRYPRFALIVSHGLTIRLFLMRWLHWTVEEFEQLSNPDNCQIITLRLNNVTERYDLKFPLKKKHHSSI